MKSLNLGIVGLGYWGPNYARVISELADANLLWCCDINKMALLKFKNIYPQTKTTENIKDLLNDQNLNGVIIVTPAQTHFKLAKQFLEKDQNILVEKPLTDNLASSKKLVKLSKRKNKVLMVDHTFIFNPAIQKLKNLLESGELGRIYYLYGNYNALGPIRRDVSVMWDLPHFIYVVNYLLKSKPKWVSAQGKYYLQKGMEDVVFLNFEYPEDIMFNLNCSWIDPVKVRKLVIIGEKKMAVFDDMQPDDKLTIFDRGVEIKGDPDFANLQIVVRSGDTIIPKIDKKEPLKEVVLAFIKSIMDEKTNISSGEEGLSLVEALNAAQISLRKNGEKIWLKKVI